MAYREIGMWEILEVLRRVARGERQRAIERVTGHSRSTIRRWLRAARKLGWEPGRGEPDEPLAAAVAKRVRPVQDEAAPGESQLRLLPHREQIRAWLAPEDEQGPGGLTKSGRARRVALSRRLRDALANHYSRQFEPGPDSLVLGSLDPASFRRRDWRRILKRARLETLSPKDLRDTYASWLLTAGVNLGYVSTQLGHSDIGVTVRHYAKWCGGSEYRDPMQLAPGEVPADLLARLENSHQTPTTIVGDDQGNFVTDWDRGGIGRVSRTEKWWALQGSNLGPSGYEPVALTTELRALGVRGYHGEPVSARFEIGSICCDHRRPSDTQRPGVSHAAQVRMQPPSELCEHRAHRAGNGARRGPERQSVLHQPPRRTERLSAGGRGAPGHRARRRCLLQARLTGRRSGGLRARSGPGARPTRCRGWSSPTRRSPTCGPAAPIRSAPSATSPPSRIPSTRRPPASSRVWSRTASSRRTTSPRRSRS